MSIGPGDIPEGGGLLEGGLLPDAPLPPPPIEELELGELTAQTLTFLIGEKLESCVRSAEKTVGSCALCIERTKADLLHGVIDTLGSLDTAASRAIDSALSDVEMIAASLGCPIPALAASPAPPPASDGEPPPSPASGVSGPAAPTHGVPAAGSAGGASQLAAPGCDERPDSSCAAFWPPGRFPTLCWYDCTGAPHSSNDPRCPPAIGPAPPNAGWRCLPLVIPPDEEPPFPRPPDDGEPSPPPAPEPPPTEPPAPPTKPPLPPKCAPTPGPCTPECPREHCAYWSPNDLRCYWLHGDDPAIDPSDELLFCEPDITVFRSRYAEECAARSRTAPLGGDIPPGFTEDAFRRVDECESANVMLQGYDTPLDWTIGRAWGVYDDAGNPTIPARLAAKPWYSPTHLLNRVVLPITRVIADSLDWLRTIAGNGAACGGISTVAIAVPRVIFSFASRWFGSAFDYFLRPWDLLANYQCPTNIPSAESATEAFLANTISEKQLECWVRANGNHWLPWQRIVDARRNRLGVADVIVSWRRGMITADDADQKLRELGYTDPIDRRRLRDLSAAVPPISEIIRYMVRDVGDEALVARFGMDAEFDLKWSAQLKEWGRAQGVDDEFARASWRAHWDLPSPTQLYEMYHRLRRLPAGDPRRVTLDDIETALRQADVLPYWIPKLLAVSFRPLTRIDVRRAYNIGVLTRDDVKDAYLNLGYDDANAETLARFTEQERLQRLARSPLVKPYLDGAATEEETRQTLADAGIVGEQAETVLRGAKRRLAALTKLACYRSLKRRYLSGEFDQSFALARLQDLGFEGADGQVRLDGWTCEKFTRSKQASLSQLCDWLERGFIDSVEFETRLTRLGWSKDDAIRLIRSCEGRINRKLMLSAEKQEAAVRRAMEKERRAQDKATRAQEAARDRALKALEKARVAREKREAQLLDAAEIARKKLDITIGAAMGHIRAAMRDVLALPGVTTDDAIEAVVAAAEGKSYDAGGQIRRYAVEYAQAEQTAATAIP